MCDKEAKNGAQTARPNLFVALLENGVELRINGITVDLYWTEAEQLATELLRTLKASPLKGRDALEEHELQDLRMAVAKKVATWESLCRCHDEFEGDAIKYCGEYADADDAAMLELQKVHVRQTSAAALIRNRQ